MGHRGLLWRRSVTAPAVGASRRQRSARRDWELLFPQVRVSGRLKIRLVAGEQEMFLPKSRQGEADLILLKGKFYLAAACDIPIRTCPRLQNSRA